MAGSAPVASVDQIFVLGARSFVRRSADPEAFKLEIGSRVIIEHHRID
jgi:hypothetical protein